MTSYLPRRRTALVFCGTGVHGAYHAGVLRALQEAGVKIDVVAGQGIGAGIATLAAIDGAAQLCGNNGMWRGSGPALYGWNRSMVMASRMVSVLAAVVCFPLLFLAMGLVVYPLGLLAQVTRFDTSGDLLAGYSELLFAMFVRGNLSTILTGLCLSALMGLSVVLLGVAFLKRKRAQKGRLARGRWWWRLLDGVLDVEAARGMFKTVIGQLIGEPTVSKKTSLDALGRRYADMLTEHLGQPGFRELVLVATDLDTHQDLVGALLQEPFRGAFMAARLDQSRESEVLDLAGADGDHALTLLGAALTPPLVCDPQMLTFGPEQFWRGETHRLCDRPGALARLILELGEAGVTQAIIVSSVAPVITPHRLRAPRLEPRSRLGEFVMTAEASALREAMVLAKRYFQGAYLISPTHNPIGPFDSGGAYDERSARWRHMPELLNGGYEDAYRQFIEPVVGASGDYIGRNSTHQTRRHKERTNGPGLFDKTD